MVMNTEKKKNRKIRKGDKVIAIAGNNRGMSGEVLSLKGERVIVQGLNVRSKHRKKQGTQPGQIVQMECPLHISNLKLCVGDNTPVKLRARTNTKGARELYYNEGKKAVVYRSVKQPAK